MHERHVKYTIFRRDLALFHKRKELAFLSIVQHATATQKYIVNLVYVTIIVVMRLPHLKVLDFAIPNVLQSCLASYVRVSRSQRTECAYLER